MQPAIPLPVRPRRTWTRDALPPLSVERGIPPVIDHLDPARLAILAGAGISLAPPSGLPTAERFLRSFYETCLSAGSEPETFLRAAPDLRFEGVLEVVQRRFDPGLDILGAFAGGSPNRNHRHLAALARRGALIVTTNFDLLIEEALRESGEFGVRLRPGDFTPRQTADRGPEVWHLHGALRDPRTGDGAIDSIVVSIRDCWRSRESFALDRAKGAALADALADRDLLVVGYSGADDYDVAPALEAIASSRRVVWVQHTPSDGGPLLADGVTPLWIDQLPDGSAWYRAPGANSLTAMVSDGCRRAERVHLVAGETAAVLSRLSGRALPRDRPTVPPALVPAEPLPVFLAGWRERHLTSPLSAHLLAILLSRIGGLADEGRRLLAGSGSLVSAEDFAGLDVATLAETLRTLMEIQPLMLEEFPAASAPLVLGTEPLWRELWARADQPALRAASLTLWGRALLAQGRTGEAIDRFGESLAVRRGEPSIPDLDAAEHDLALVLFMDGFPSRDLEAAAAQVDRALAVAEAAGNPEGVSRALLLRARIAERRERQAEARSAYEQARVAAARSGLEGLIAVTAGELGLCLWTAVAARSAESLFGRSPVDFEALVRRATELMAGGIPEIAADDRPDAELAAACLAEAFRVHSRRGEAHGLIVVGSSLAEVLDGLGERCRSLLAHCAVYFAALASRDPGVAGEALERIRRGARRELPELALEGLGEEDAVAAVQRELLARDWLI